MKGDRTGAIEATRRAAAFEPFNPQIVATLALYLAEQGSLEEAEKTAKDLVGRWPYYAEGWNRFGVVLDRRGKLTEAVTAVHRAIELEPRNAEFTLWRVAPTRWANSSWLSSMPPVGSPSCA